LVLLSHALFALAAIPFSGLIALYLVLAVGCRLSRVGLAARA